ncbi:putative reverse transcriptase [Metarhizium anisopliae]|nr:putative reverse transcriptase [Metarhizium anisopliae]
MVISQPATPERGAGAQLDEQYPDSFNLRARQQLLKTGPPVTLQPFQPSGSPTRSLAAYDRDRGHRHTRRLDKGTQDSTTNRFAALAKEDNATQTSSPVFDLEAETEEIIKTQKERLDIRAKVLRTYAEAITACTRKFTTGYGLHIANEFQNTLLRHWNQFVRAEAPLIPGNKNTPALSSLTGTNKPTPPAPAARESTRSDKLLRQYDNTTKCANCYGAHGANYENCFARPQKLRGSFQKLSKTQLIYAWQLGQEDFKRKNNTQQTDSDQLPLAVEQGDEDAFPLQDAEMSGTEPIQTTQVPETNPVNIVDHEDRGDTPGERAKEKDDEETEEEAAEGEEAEEEEIKEALPPPAQSYPTGTNTKQDQHVIPKLHFYITGKGALQTATKQNSTTSTSTIKDPYFTIKKQFRPQPRTDDIEAPSEATARESPSEITSGEIIEIGISKLNNFSQHVTETFSGSK